MTNTILMLLEHLIVVQEQFSMPLNVRTHLEAWRIAKGNLVTKHQTWIDTIQKQCDQLNIGLKAYRHLSEGIELATELGIQVDEAELIRTNSTGLTIYNPSNLASMIKERFPFVILSFLIP